MRCLLISLCVGLALWMGISCVDSPPFRLASFMQDGRHDVRLNERLILTFTHEVDRSSLSPAAARIIDDSGLPAEGKWEVRGKEVHFLPRLPRHADGSDAGLSPGRPYRVEFAGFPAVSALRSTGGLLLAQAFSRSFNTVSTDVEELDRFVDPAPESGPALVAVGGKALHTLDMAGVDVAPGEELALAFSEPIYPPSIFRGDSELHIIDLEGTVDLDSNTLHLECRSGEDLRTVRVKPSDGFQAGRKYKLFRSYLAFTDFGGNPIEAKQFDFISIACRSE